MTLDRRLRVLARGSALVQRAIGKGLALMAEVNGFQALGYSTLNAYARQRLGISGRHARELAAIEKRMPGFPCIDRAYQEGRLNFSQVREMLRYLELIDDADWAKVAEGLTVSQLKEGLQIWKRALDAQSAPAESQAGGEYPLAIPDEEEAPQAARWVEFTASPLLAAKYDVAMEMLRRTMGADLPAGEPVEYMLGEFMSGEGGPALAASDYRGCNVVEDDREERASRREWRKQVMAARMREIEIDCLTFSDHWSYLDWRTPNVRLDAASASCESREPAQIDAHLQVILAVERRFEKHFLWMLETFRRGNCHFAIEFPSFQHYCEVVRPQAHRSDADRQLGERPHHRQKHAPHEAGPQAAHFGQLLGDLHQRLAGPEDEQPAQRDPPEQRGLGQPRQGACLEPRGGLRGARFRDSLRRLRLSRGL
ncbi:MAG: hypothetical protein FJX76_13485 [Armatimonadetes bacterium]|nr:hypothetical protein [Armatimonadota bacterium]